MDISEISRALKRGTCVYGILPNFQDTIHIVQSNGFKNLCIMPSGSPETNTIKLQGRYTNSCNGNKSNFPSRLQDSLIEHSQRRPHDMQSIPSQTRRQQAQPLPPRRTAQQPLLRRKPRSLWFQRSRTNSRHIRPMVLQKCCTENVQCRQTTASRKHRMTMPRYPRRKRGRILELERVGGTLVRIPPPKHITEEEP